ncbi:MAG: hypothetical protein ABMB14_06355 [Myxococcota bacterium]
MVACPISPALPGGTLDDSTLATRFDAGLGLAGKHTSDTLEDLASGGGLPGAYVIRSGTLSITRFAVANSERAVAMFEQAVKGEFADAEVVTLVVDSYAQVPGGARIDALEVRVVIPGTDTAASIVVPYQRTDGGFTFPNEAQLIGLTGVPGGYDGARLQRMFLTGAGKGPFPRRVGDDWASAGPAAKPVPDPPDTRSLTERIGRMAALAPFAGLIAVAGADGTVDQAEMKTFMEALLGCQDPVVRAILGAGERDPANAVKRLFADATLAPRALAAAGAIFERSPTGRAAFMDILRRVAAVHGEALREPEREALAQVEKALDAGIELALSGPDPYDGASARRVELMDHAALAPFAMFMAVAGADGELQKSELESFGRALDAVADPLLTEILHASRLSPVDRLERLGRDRGDLADRSIFALGVLLAEEPGGEAARTALLALLAPVAAGRPTEQQVLDRLAASLVEAGKVASERPRPANGAARGGLTFGSAGTGDGGSRTLVWVVAGTAAVGAVALGLWLFGG